MDVHIKANLSIKTYVVKTYLNHLYEIILMSAHSICFLVEIK